MQRDRRLEWVKTNRAPRNATPRVGAFITGFVDSALKQHGAERSQLAAILAGGVDEEFRRHCRLGEVRGGMLIIQVDEPGLVSAMRLAWGSRLLAVLREHGARQGVRRVSFEFGRSGAPLDGGQPTFGEARKGRLRVAGEAGGKRFKGNQAD
jgi:hypothetical protein